MDVESKAYSPLSYVGIFILEVAYIIILYEPNSPHTQAGVMIILAVEVSFMFRVSKINVEQKRVEGRVSKTSRIYTMLAGLTLLALMAMSASLFNLDRIAALWMLLFAAMAFFKIMWERQNRFRMFPTTSGTHKFPNA